MVLVVTSNKMSGTGEKKLDLNRRFQSKCKFDLGNHVYGRIIYYTNWFEE